MSVRNIAVVLSADSTSLRSQLIAAARQVDAFDASITKAGRSSAESSALMASAAKGGAVVLAVAFAGAVKGATDFEAAMRNVNSISGLSETQFKAQGEAVLNLSRRLPQSAKTLAEGLYDIASSGFQGAEGLEVLQKSAVAASAGLTTTQNAAKAITAVLNAYGKEASEAGAVSDVLFQTVNLGVVNFEELTGVIGDTVGAAAAAGISIEEVGAAVATMTLSGQSAAEAGTSLNRVITELIKPGDELLAVFKSLGYESGIAAVQSLGLMGTMELLREATGGSTEAVLALFKETRAARGAFALMADEGQKYAEVTEGITHASDGAGAAQKALNEQMKSLSAQWKVFVNGLNAGAIEAGNAVLPFISDFLRGANDLGHDALPGLQAGFQALAPFFHNVAEAGGDIVDIAGQLIDSLSPLGKVLLGIAAGGAITSLNALAAVLSSITGFLADHEQIVTAAAVAWAAFFLAAKGAAALAALPVLLDTIAFGLYGMAGAADTAAASLLTLRGAAVALGAVAGVLALTAAIGGMKSAKQAADELSASLKQGLDLSTLAGLTEHLSRIAEQRDALRETTNEGNRFTRFLQTVVELATPLPNTLADASDAYNKLGKDAELSGRQLVQQGENINAIRNATGLTSEAVEELAHRLGVDLTKGFNQSGPERQKVIDSAKLTAAQLHDVQVNAYGAGRGLQAMGEQGEAAAVLASQRVDELAKKTGEAFGKSVDLIGGYAKAQQENAAAVDDLAQAQDRAASAADRVAQAQDQAAQAQARVGDAAEKAAEATERVTDAQEKAADAERHVGELRVELAERAADAQEAYAEKVAKANESILDAQQGVVDAQDRVTEAEQKVADMRTDFAERAAEAQEAYAEKVQQSDDNILRAEEDLADKRISLAEDVADAQRRLEEDRLQGEERIQAAEERIRDVQKRNADEARERQQRESDRRRLDAASSPEERKRIQSEIDARKAREDDAKARQQAAQDLKDAQDDLAKARKDAAATEEKNRKALADAQEKQAKGIQDAEENVAKARAEGLKVQQEAVELTKQQAKDEKDIAAAIKDVDEARRGVVDAEKGLAEARKESLQVQKEGQQLTKQQAEDEKQIADAVKAAESARRDVLDAQKDAARATDDIARAQADAAKAAGDVGKAQGEAAKAYGDLAEAQQKVADTSLEGFFARTIADAQLFADGIREAARKGLDPHFIAELLQEGPDKAAPILRGIMSDQGDRLVEMLNQSSGKVREMQLLMVDTARATQRAIETTSNDMARDYGTALDILAVKAAMGGQATSDAIAEKLGIGVDRVRQIGKDYILGLVDGINPLLRGIGSPEINDPTFNSDLGAGRSYFLAGGGQVPGGYGTEDSVDAKLTPGEIVFSVPAVKNLGAENLLDLHERGRRGFNTGGFVYPTDVPPTPDFSAYGNVLGYSGDETMKKLHDDIARFLADHPPMKEGSSGPGGSAYGFQALIDYLNMKGVEHEVTSTTGGGHAEGSRHYDGLAADFWSAHMNEIGDAFMEIRGSMYELIHNPGYSVKGGENVSPDFWGADTWANHESHVHAATFRDAAEGPGIPTGSGGSESGGSAAGDDSRAIGREMAAQRGWTGSEWTALDNLWTQESSWDSNAVNPSSGAYGIPQSLGHGHPYDLGDTRAQVAWGLDYIADRYGDPEAAWQHEQDYGWYGKGGFVQADLRSYDQGGWLPPGLTMAYNGTGRPEAVGGGAIDYDKLAAAITRAARPVEAVFNLNDREFARATAPAMAGALDHHRTKRQ